MINKSEGSVERLIFNCIIGAYFFLSLFKVFTLLDPVNTNFLQISNSTFYILKIILVVLLFIRVALNIQNVDRKKIIVFFTMWTALAILQLFIGRYIDFSLILLIAFAINIDSKSIYKAILLGLLVGVCLEIFLVFNGTILNSLGGVRLNDVGRFNFGFYGLMIFGRVVRVIAMCHVMITKSPKLLHMGFILMLSYFCYYETKTRSEFLFVIFIYVMSFLVRRFDIKKFKNYLFMLGSVTLWLLPVISSIFGKYYNEIPMLQSLNQFTTGRLQYSSWLWDILSPKLFGNRWFQFSNGLQPGDIGYFYNFVDNGWDHLILIQGLISTLIVLVSLQLILYLLTKNSEMIELILMIFIIILFTFSQSVMFDIIMNPLLIKLGLYFKNGRSKNFEKHTLRIG